MKKEESKEKKKKVSGKKYSKAEVEMACEKYK